MAIRTLLLLSLLALPARGASAQAPAAPATPPAAPAANRFQISVDVGAQAKTSAFSDTFEQPLNQETEQIRTDYPGVSGLFFSVGARYRLWKQLTVGAGVSQFVHDGDAKVTAQLPHPFFDNQPRTIEGTDSLRRQEFDVHPTIGWLLPLSPSVQLAVNAGPSILTVTQDMVTDVNYSESYPYDTATFTSADVRESSATAVGVYVGADVTWMFSKRIGAGGLVQFSRATVKQKVGDRTISIDAGGLQAGGGIRFVF